MPQRKAEISLSVMVENILDWAISREKMMSLALNDYGLKYP